MRACPHCTSDAVIKRGFYPVSGPTNHKRVQRYFCKACLKKFSAQTGAVTYREKKPYVNQTLFRTLCSGVSERSTAFLIGINRKTVASKMRRLGLEASRRLADSFEEHKAGAKVVFDEMETFEHSKAKPLSIAVAVDHTTRRIISVDVASMPAKGPLAALSRKKYGPRRDDRRQALEKMARQIERACPRLDFLRSDECPRYPAITRQFFPEVLHQTYKGRRGCVVGQGELKRGGFDPLFSLNHTCAMFRDHIKRLSRRTWCTTKQASGLQALLWLYAWFHNQLLEGAGRLVSI